MPITYIAPPKNGGNHQKGVVYKDSPLPLEYALAYRRKVSGPNTFVFMANEVQNIPLILSHLMRARGNGFNPEQVPKIFAEQGFHFNEEIVTALKNQQNPPQFEIILPNAVIVIKENGVAYVDPKGNDAPPELKKGEQSLGGFWIHFYHEKKDKKAQQELARKIYFHTIKQQQENDDYNAIPLMLRNLDILEVNLNNVEALKKAEPKDRKIIVETINNGELNSKLKTRFKLKYIDERQNEQQWRERKGQLEAAQDRLKFFHEAAKNKEATMPRHVFRKDPDTAWAEVLIETPPDFVPDKVDLNKFTTTREDSSRVVNTFQLKERNIVVKSTEGEVTYKERFEKIAADLLALLSRPQDESGIPSQLPSTIVINKVNPPSKEQECLNAFKKIFMGKSTIQMNQPSNPKEPSISAALPW